MEFIIIAELVNEPSNLQFGPEYALYGPLP